VRIMLEEEAATFGQLRPGLSVTAKVKVAKVDMASIERAGR